MLFVCTSIPTLKKGEWVRLRRGVFKEDLAQVDYVEPSHNSVHVKMIPRIDYTKMRGEFFF